MTRWTMLATAAALTLGLTATLAQAEPDHRRGQGHSQAGGHKGHGNARPDHGRPGARPDHGRPGDVRPGHPNRPNVHRPPGYGGPQHAHGGRYYGAGPQHNWVRGSRLPPQYRSRHYVVNDWHGHRLSRPQHGYHWVQYGGDYLLVAIASGVIAQLILSH